MRNEAAHAIEFSLRTDDLRIFQGMTASDGQTRLNDPKHIQLLCIEIVLGFWNAHVDFFGPLFMPELFPTYE